MLSTTHDSFSHIPDAQITSHVHKRKILAVIIKTVALWSNILQAHISL